MNRIMLLTSRRASRGETPQRETSPRVRQVALLATVTLLAAACGGSSASTTDVAAAPADEAEVAATATPEPEPTATTQPSTATPVPSTATPEPGPTAISEPVIAAGCSADADIETFSDALESGGNTYEFSVTIPSDYLVGEPNPMIINYHGLGSNGFEQSALSLLTSKTSRHITVHPTGQTGFPDNRNSWGLAAGEEGRDDLAFSEDLIDWISERVCVDQNRIYAMGMSNGAFMSASIVCNLPDRFAAAASVAGVSFPEGNCNPDSATPFIAFHGTDDTVVPFNGGGFSTLSGVDSDEPNPFFEQIMPEEFSQFASEFSCGDAVAEDFSETVIKYNYPDCENSAELAFYEVGGGGHSWPGSVISLAIPSLGPTNMEIDATQTIIDFFDRHSLDN